MSNRDSDFWMRELARTGMTTKAQKDFLASLSNAVDTRGRYFPAYPVIYVERVRRFIMHTFLPQMGPLLLSVDPSYPPERISRSQCWQIAHLELSLLDGPSRPVDELHTAISDIVTILTRNEFPLSIPSRWLMELFGILERVVTLKMEARRWAIRHPGPLDTERHAFVEAVVKNMENDRRRSQRQLVSPFVDDSDALLDSCGQSLLPPDDDPIVPAIPPTFPWDHRPHLWREIPR